VTTNNSFWPEKQYNQLRKELIEATKAMKVPEPAAEKKPPVDTAPRPGTSPPKEKPPSSKESDNPAENPAT
jgi:hypothetical protein